MEGPRGHRVRSASSKNRPPRAQSQGVGQTTRPQRTTAARQCPSGWECGCGLRGLICLPLRQSEHSGEVRAGMLGMPSCSVGGARQEASVRDSLFLGVCVQRATNCGFIWEKKGLAHGPGRASSGWLQNKEVLGERVLVPASPLPPFQPVPQEFLA